MYIMYVLWYSNRYVDGTFITTVHVHVMYVWMSAFLVVSPKSSQIYPQNNSSPIFITIKYFQPTKVISKYFPTKQYMPNLNPCRTNESRTQTLTQNGSHPNLYFGSKFVGLKNVSRPNSVNHRVHLLVSTEKCLTKIFRPPKKYSHTSFPSKKSFSIKLYFDIFWINHLLNNRANIQEEFEYVAFHEWGIWMAM